MRYSVPELHRIWEWLNYSCFDSKLERIPFRLTRKKGIFGQYKYKKGIRRIEMSAYMCRYPSIWVETLYHEMCHQYQYEVEWQETKDKEESWEGGHGPTFRKIYDTGLDKFWEAQAKLPERKFTPDRYWRYKETMRK